MRPAAAEIDRGPPLLVGHASEGRRAGPETGERLLRRTERAVAAAEEDLLTPLDQEQREQLDALLRRPADGVDLCPTADDATCAE
jgi:hypothetical protein